MNTIVNSVYYTHEQLSADMEWAAQLNGYRSQLRNMKTYLETLVSNSLSSGILEKARCMLQQLAHQQYHIDEIAHIARMNEYALLARMNGDQAAVENHRNASRIKEQSLLQFFGKGFLRFNNEYVQLCDEAQPNERQCG